MDDFEMARPSTHLPLLLRAVMMTNGPVLEMGIGNYSTLVLHEVYRGRRLVSIESNPQWFFRFAHLQSESHDLRLSAYDACDEFIRSVDWDVAFLDHGPKTQRGRDLARLHHAKFVVIHDVEYYELDWYGMAKELESFRYRYIEKSLFPNTAVVSDTVDVESGFRV